MVTGTMAGKDPALEVVLVQAGRLRHTRMSDPDNRGLRALDDVLKLLSAEGRGVQSITLHPDGRIEIAMGPATEPNALDRWRRERKSYRGP